MPPSFVILLTDDQRGVDDGAGVNLRDNVPNLTAEFADRGTLFDEWYVPTSICAPSRASSFSGRYAEQTFVRINEERNNFLDFYSFVRVLQQAGYDTGMVGKYLWTSRFDPYNPRLPIASKGEWYRPNWFNHRWKCGPTRYEAENDRDAALAFLEPHLSGEDERPFMLWLSTNIPHAGYGAQPETAWDHIDDFTHPPSAFETPEQLALKAPSNRGVISDHTRDLAEADWAGMDKEMNALDQQIPAIFDAFSEAQREDTIFIWYSDNGYMLGEHGLVSKQYPYIESIKLFCYISAITAGIAEGAVDHRLCANIDLCPTILELAGLTDKYPYAMGLDLLGATEREWLYTSLPAGASGSRHVGQWRQALLTDGGGPVTRTYCATPQADGTDWIEDYDLTTDPYQLEASNEYDAEVAGLMDNFEASLARDTLPLTGSEFNVCR